MKNLLRNALVMGALIASTASILEARPYRHRRNGHRAPARVTVQVVSRPQYFRPVRPCRQVLYYTPMQQYVVPVRPVVQMHHHYDLRPRFGFSFGFGF
jgi:hypothetical protein